MKSLKSIAGIFACASILLTGCEKEFKAGEDTTKPVPTDLQYDVEYSRPDTMAVCWNAAEAIAAGATSFNVELCDSPDDAVNTYDDNILTVKVSSIGADGIAHASRALLVVSVQLLGAGHHLAVLGVTLALGDGDNNGLCTGDGGNDTRTDLTRVTRISHVLSLGPTRRQRTSPLRSRGRAAP